MDETQRQRLVWIGVIGAGVAALCCFTPLLVVLFGVVGLGAITGYLDYVVLPALAGFVGLALYAGTRTGHAKRNLCCPPSESKSRNQLRSERRRDG